MPASFFATKLLHWHGTENIRILPWKNEKDPYKIWLSEIILQQTRAEQGLPYYNKFISKYPTVFDLAQAHDEEVFKLWEGLGYYNRCRNLLFTARYIAAELHGVFPTSHANLLNLKGVGAYTAAAIASFAYNLPHAVIDGNVYRILARVFNIHTPTDSLLGKKEFADLAYKLLPKQKPALYNQAIMDFGATVCTPKQPKCSVCPLQSNCQAYSLQTIDLLPIKKMKKTVQKRYLLYAVCFYKGKLFIHHRSTQDIWQNLHEFYLLKDEDKLIDEQAVNILHHQFGKQHVEIVHQSKCYKQQLTHRLVEAKFIAIQLKKINQPLFDRGTWITLDEFSKKAFPKIINEYIRHELNSLLHDFC